MSAIDQPADLTLAGRFEPGEDRQMREVPFEVPPGHDQLHIAVSYDHRIGSDPFATGGNTLDLGLFDELGLGPELAGFRGWSGSELLQFTVGSQWATPPYRSGPIRPGSWQLLLGPYKIAPGGLNYEIAIWFDPHLERPPAPEPIAPPIPSLITPAAEPGWVRGDLHCHSIYSDGDSTPEELLTIARARGLDFLAITDHNSAVRHHAAPPNGPLLIPGVEVTTYRGHWNAWGVDDRFDFRDDSNAALEREMARATAAGALVSINHPRPFGPDWLPGVLRGAPVVEAWNGQWERLNVVSLGKWDTALAGGHRLVAVGGSDAHHFRTQGSDPLPPTLGEPTTWVQIDGPLSVAAVLDGIRAGRCFISASPAGPQLYLRRTSDGLALRAVDAGGGAALVIGRGVVTAAFGIDRDDWSIEAPWPPNSAYARAQLVDGLGRVYALSNALWREPEG